MEAWRFTHQPASDPIDFVPSAALAGGARGHRQCSNYALSFFSTLEKARKHFARLAARLDAEARYGGFVAKIALIETDGVLSPRPSKSGHLNLYEEEGASFAGRVAEYAAADDGGA
jgi:hypothetical protein